MKLSPRLRRSIVEAKKFLRARLQAHAVRQAQSRQATPQRKKIPWWQTRLGLGAICLTIAMAMTFGSWFLVGLVNWSDVGKKALWVFGAIVCLVALVFIFKILKSQRTRIPYGRILKWSAAIAILFWLSPWQWFRVTPENRVILTAIEPCTRIPAQEGKFSLTVTKDDWSPTYCFPEGGWDVRWVGESHSRFQARVNGGSVYSFTPEHSDPVLEADHNIRTGSFRALGEQETITITVRRPY